MSSNTNPLTRGKKQKALALLQRDQAAEAIPLLEQACRADRRDAEAWFMLAAVHQKLGAFAPAADAYRQSIALRPDHAEACYYLGNTCMALGDATGAIEAFRQAIRIRPGYLEAHMNLGALFELQKNPAAAETSFREAVRLAPRDARLHYHLGNALQSQERFEEAVAAYRQALALRPDHADTYNNLGNALARLDRYEEALGSYDAALKREPQLAAAWNNLGNTHARQGRHDAAVGAYQRALAINPCDADALTSLGNVRRHQGRLDEAVASHRRAIEISPEHADAHFNLAFALLVAGHFREGWREYAWHWRREGGQRRPFTPSTWDGRDLAGGRVFLHAEQGIGDEIFFLRFAPELKHRGAGRVVYRPGPKLASLLTRTPVIDEIADPDAAPTAGDRVFSVGDLPRLLGMERVEQIPPSIPLLPLPARVEAMRRQLAELGPPPYVGVTWRAGTPARELVLFKESAPGMIAGILRDLPVTVLVLQRHPAAGEVEAFQQALGRPVHDFSALNEDLESMLALLSLLDDYVGVSNTNMHLRAAVGKTARVLVPAPPEWRWMAEGRESPWFPGFGVYRQGYDGDWDTAFVELAADLKKSLSHR